MKRFLLTSFLIVALGTLVLGDAKISKNAETFPIEPSGIAVFHK
ncbi:hypothetical protein [Tumebacillus flagellatus]|nr:hypothetical protein [Tumebacillus flagellatus]